jgi:hypothetical protein
VLAKLTSKNQLTLPKSAVESLDHPLYFDVAVREGQLVLTPVRLQRADAVRSKLAALGLSDAGVGDAVRWARSGKNARVAPVAAEPAPDYAAAPSVGSKTTRRKAPGHG